MTEGVHRLTPGEIPAALLIVAGGIVAQANERAADLLGVPVEDLVGRSLGGLLTPDPRAAPGSSLHRCPDGRPVRVSVDRAGDLTVVVLTDVSEERRLAAIVDRVADTTFLMSRDGLVTWESDGLVAQLPEGVDSGVGLNPLERVHPEDLPEALEAFAAAVVDPSYSRRYEVRARSISDPARWETIEISGVSAIGDPDIDGVVVQVRNLDAGRFAASHARTHGPLRFLADTVPLGVVALDRTGRTVYRNPAAAELLGQPAGPHSGIEWVDAVAVDAHVALGSLVTAALVEGRSGIETVRLGAETADRTRRWVRVRVAPQLDETLAAVGAVAILEDVSEEVEARHATERLTQMLDATSDYVAVFRPSGEILYVNAALQRVLASLRAAGAKGELRDLMDDEPRRRFVRDAEEALRTADIWRGELEIKVGPDEKVPVSALAVVRHDADGSLEWIAMSARDITDVKAAEARLRHLATRDPLTGLANRALGYDRLRQAVARHRRLGTGVAVLFCDLDAFKPVNDAHGHAVGDRLLATVADRLEQVIRQVDSVSRVGGDEFLVVVEGSTDPDELAALAERLIDAVTRPVTLDSGVDARVGISIGIAVAGPGVQVDPDRLLSVADTAMYRAKAHGGDGYRITRLES